MASKYVYYRERASVEAESIRPTDDFSSDYPFALGSKLLPMLIHHSREKNRTPACYILKAKK